MSELQKARTKTLGYLIRKMNKAAFHGDFMRNLPEQFHQAALLAFTRSATAEEKALAKKIESFRKTIPSLQEKKELHSYSSPHSDTYETNDQGHAVPGPYITSSVQAHMKTGIKKSRGILLRRIVEGLGARRVLELGTNTGFSGCYFLSAPTLEELVTIEGSKDLCSIAEKNMSRISRKFRLMEMLFDDAIDLLQGENARFDCAFIDGQHEREATLHYADRVKPIMAEGGALIFDDIYWSDGMNDAWREACFSADYSTTLDLGQKGIGILRQGDEPKRHYDICDYIGRTEIHHKGW